MFEQLYANTFLEISIDLKLCIHKLIGHFNTCVGPFIYEFSGRHLECNEAYRFIKAYLSANSSKNAKKLIAEVRVNRIIIVINMDKHERVSDTFNGVNFWWLSCKVESSLLNLQYFRPEKDSISGH